MYTADEGLAKARALQEALWESGIAYGDPPRLWRVSPKWYYLWGRQWEQALAFGRLLPFLRRAIDGDESATYLRADFTLDQKGNLVLVEVNDTPVWDFGTQAVRRLYHEVLGLPEKNVDPFPGAAKAITSLLKRKFAGRRIVILISPDRVNYRAEYVRLAGYFAEQGLETVASDDDVQIRAGDVVYRTFGSGWLNDRLGWSGLELARLLRTGDVSVWPPFTGLEDKTWMSYPFNTLSDNGVISTFTSWPLSSMGEYLPSTWLVAPTSKGLPWGKRNIPWHANELMGDLTTPDPKKLTQPRRLDWVLKPTLGGQGKGTVFSSEIGPEEWRRRLLEALLSFNGHGPHYVIQSEVRTLRHKVIYLNELGTGLEEGEDYRVRLCVTYLTEGETVELIDADATLRDHPLVHGSSDAVIQPVIIRTVGKKGGQSAV